MIIGLSKNIISELWYMILKIGGWIPLCQAPNVTVWHGKQKNFKTKLSHLLKNLLKQKLFYVLALSVSAKTDKHKVFFIDQIFKKAKNQNGQPIMSHRDARGFSSKSFRKHFLIVLKIWLQVPLIPSYFNKHSDVAF